VPPSAPPRARHLRARDVAELIVAGLGGAALAAAWQLDFEWFERYFAFESTSAGIALAWRALLGVVGVALALVARPRAGRWVRRLGAAHALATCARVVVALGLSLVAAEVGLRLLGLPRRHDMAIAEVRLAETHPRYGWLFKASRSFTVETGGRPVHYDFDADHNRAASPRDVPDPAAPTIVFAGESVTAGHGLAWDESYPAIVGDALGLQTVNLGVDGYAADQAFLRLADALPHLEQPVAVVTFFFPPEVDRLERVDHPRVVFDGVTPRVVPPSFVEELRLSQAFREALTYRSDAAIAATGEVLRQTARLAKERGARAIFLAPHLRTTWPRGDGYLIDELLVRQGLTVVSPQFGFEPIPGDNHPNAASTRRLAEAVILALQAELARR
jgi:hypothetical protein